MDRKIVGYTHVSLYDEGFSDVIRKLLSDGWEFLGELKTDVVPLRDSYAQIGDDGPRVAAILQHTREMVKYE